MRLFVSPQDGGVSCDPPQSGATLLLGQTADFQLARFAESGAEEFLSIPRDGVIDEKTCQGDAEGRPDQRAIRRQPTDQSFQDVRSLFGR